MDCMLRSLMRQRGCTLRRVVPRQLFSAAAVHRGAFSWTRAVATPAEQVGSRSPAAAAAAWQRHQLLPPSAALAATPVGQEQGGSSAAQHLPHLQQLSEEQLSAVTAPLGTVRVVAGPGSGKTRVLTARIAHLVAAQGAQPWQVLAITFTNKAANEMRERLEAVLGEEGAQQLFAGTFHSLCYRILKQHVADLRGSGRTASFTVYDQDMSLRLLAAAVRKWHPDWKAKEVNAKAAALQDAVSKVKSSMLTWHAATPEAVERAVMDHLATPHGASVVPEAWANDIAGWFAKYERALRDNNALDFDDLLGLTVALLRSNDDVRQRYLRRFRHVLVDEFQDTNTAQYQLVKLLSMPRADLFVVGDPDQAIYGWRGADMTNMTQAFTRDFPQAQVFDLRDNYRSSARIVTTAQQVIAANEDWKRAGLRPKKPAGHPIEVHVLEDSHVEARFIATEIQRTLGRGDHPEDQVAVLFRTHMQSRLVEQELVRRNIAHVLIGGVPFWRRMEVQDVVAYLRLAVSLRDDVALTRIINTPKRAIGDSSLEKLRAAASAQGTTLCTLLFGTAASAGQPSGDTSGVNAAAVLPALPDRKALGLTAKAAAALEAFRELMAGLHAAVCSQPLDRALERIIQQTGYERYVLEGGCSSGSAKEGDEQQRVQRLRQLVAAAAGYQPGQLSGAAAFDTDEDGAPAAAAKSGGSHLSRLQLAQNFLDEAALYSGAEEGGGARGVRLMTMHAAKGLEFELVFVPGCNDGLVPLVRKGNTMSPDSLAEERRLFYVSLTRAKQRLRLTHTLRNSHFGEQSREENERSRFLNDVLKAGHAVLLEPNAVDDLPHRSTRGAYRAGSRQQRSPATRRYFGGGSGSSTSSGRSGNSGGRGSRASSSGSGSRRASSSAEGQSRPGAGDGSSGDLNGFTGGWSGSSSSSSAVDQQPGGGSSAPLPPLSAAQHKSKLRGGRR